MSCAPRLAVARDDRDSAVLTVDGILPVSGICQRRDRSRGSALIAATVVDLRKAAGECAETCSSAKLAGRPSATGGVVRGIDDVPGRRRHVPVAVSATARPPVTVGRLVMSAARSDKQDAKARLREVALAEDRRVRDVLVRVDSRAPDQVDGRRPL